MNALIQLKTCGSKKTNERKELKWSCLRCWPRRLHCISFITFNHALRPALSQIKLKWFISLASAAQFINLILIFVNCWNDVENAITHSNHFSLSASLPKWLVSECIQLNSIDGVKRITKVITHLIEWSNSLHQSIAFISFQQLIFFSFHSSHSMDGGWRRKGTE